jgi:cytochrome oxidase Cu insertion factor (SCO1/SenC/PrrC family)
VAIVCAAPFVLGTLAYVFGWGVGKPANYGELIAPRPLSGPPFDQLRGKWLLVSFDSAACDARCERKLYYVRQVRRAQGAEMERIERLWVVTDSAVPRKDLFPGIEGTYVAADQRVVPQFPGNVVEHIYLVDPLGNLMLRFPPDPDPARMIKDLERLLKYSRIG